MPELAGLPPAFATLEDGHAVVRCDARAYPVEAVYAAAYTLLGSCYVRLDRPAEDVVEIRIRPREGDDLRGVVGSLANELISCAWRQTVTDGNAVRIEALTTAALSGAMGEPTADDLANFDFSDDGFEDPLGIAQSWDAAHGKADGNEEGSDAQ